MNEFDRMRYQSPEQRKKLLDEMIDFQLLADEAERRGLDKAPETEEAIRQVLRDVMVADARKGLPAPAEIPVADVRGYYDSHRDEFHEPERRRVSVLIFNDRKEAEKVLPDAQKANTAEWGKLAQRYGEGGQGPAPSSSGGPAPAASSLPPRPVETTGELGIVGPPGDAKGDHPKVPPEVRAAVFEIQGDVGAVLGRVVPVGNRFYLVRLAGRSGAHDRTFEESERSIRSILLQQIAEQREKDLEESLKKQFPVSVDEAALAQVRYPGAAAAASQSNAPAASSSAAHP
jgi:hypothetical protein